MGQDAVRATRSGRRPAGIVVSMGEGRCPSDDEAERLAFALLRRGDPAGAVTFVDSLPADRRTLRLAVTRAEGRVCFGHGELDELERLYDSAVSAGNDTLVLRVRAALADLHAFRGNPVCGEIAAQALAVHGDELIIDAERLWARGRLWRTLALCTLFVPHDRPATSLGMLERAKSDFSVAGFDAESARSAADVHFVWFLAFAEDVERARDTVGECLARLRRLDSSYVGLLLAYRVYVDFFTGDLPAVHAGGAELDRLDAAAPLHPLARVIAGYVRVACQLMGVGPTPRVLRAIDDHLDLVRSEAMLVTTGQLVGLASILIDLGYVCPEHLAVARRWASQAMVGEASTPQTGHDLAGLLARLDLLERADDAAVAAIDANVAALRDLGLRRDAGHRALRGALAARRVGRRADADRLHREALTDLPPPERRIFWETALLHNLGVTGRRPRRDVPTRPKVRLLGPEVEVEVGDRTGTVSPTTARLLVMLVAEGGSAPADRLIDVLWPEVDSVTGKARLRVALHRLRRALSAAGADEADRPGQDVADGTEDPVRRRGDLVGLAPSVEVDAIEFERLACGDSADRATALALYRSGVAEVQLAYDDVAAPLRRRLATLWRRLARQALGDARVPQATAVRIAAVAAAGGALDAHSPSAAGDESGDELDHLVRLAEARLACSEEQ
jgi:hypothetical protein